MSDTASGSPLAARARAKINLSLEVLGRRADGYHELVSLVAFAGVADTLELDPGDDIALDVIGPTAEHCGADSDNLVLKAVRELAARWPALRAGRFVLHKRLPVAAGIGGGSADAAAALRLLARLNGIDPSHPLLHDTAMAVGADVPVCLQSRTLWMRGAGEHLQPAAMPRLAAILVNPRVPVPTGRVFAALNLAPGSLHRPAPDLPHVDLSGSNAPAIATMLRDHPNDLTAAAITVQSVVADVLAALDVQDGCLLARMSGSGATCFALFPHARATMQAAHRLRAAHPEWWIRATALGDR